MVLTTDQPLTHAFTDNLFGDPEPDTYQEKITTVITHRRRVWYSVIIFMSIIGACLAVIWGSIWTIRTANRFISIPADVTHLVVKDCYVVYDNFRSLTTGFGTVSTSYSVNSETKLNEGTVTIDGHWSRHCYVGIDIQSRTTPLTIELYMSSLHFEGATANPATNNNNADQILLPFELNVIDLTSGHSDTGLGGAEDATVNRIQFNGQLPKYLKIEQRSATVVVSLPLIRYSLNAITKPPTIDIDVGFGPVYLGAEPATNFTGSFARFSAVVSNESYCVDKTILKQFYVGVDAEAAAGTAHAGLERVIGVVDTTSSLLPSISKEVLQIAVSVSSSSLYVLSNKWESSSSTSSSTTSSVTGKLRLKEGTAMSEPADISPESQIALGKTESWLETIKKSSRLQAVNIVTPLGGTLVFETGRDLYVQFKMHFLNILSGFALRPARRTMSTTLSHTRCASSKNSTLITPFFQGPSSLISLYDTAANKDVSYFRFVESAVMYSVLKNVQLAVSHNASTTTAIGFPSLAAFTRADYEVTGYFVPQTLAMRVQNTTRGYILSTISMTGAQFAITSISLLLGFLVAVGTIAGAFVKRFDLLAFLYLGRTRQIIRGAMKFTNRCSYHLWLSLFSVLSCVSFVITQRAYVFIQQPFLVSLFIHEMFLAIPAEKRDDFRRSIPIEDLCQHYAKWLSRYFVESATFPVEELKSSIKELEGVISSNIEELQTWIVRGVSLARTNTERDVEVLIPDVLVVTGKMFDEVPFPTIQNECALQGIKSLDNIETLPDMLTKARGVKLEDATIEVIQGLEFVSLLPEAFVKERRGLVPASVAAALAQGDDSSSASNLNEAVSLSSDEAGAAVDLMTIQWIEASMASFPAIDSIMAIGLVAPSNKKLLEQVVLLFTIFQRSIQVVLMIMPVIVMHLAAVFFSDVKGSISALPAYITSQEFLMPFIQIEYTGVGLTEATTMTYFYTFIIMAFFEPLIVLVYRGIDKYNYVPTEKKIRQLITGIVTFLWIFAVFLNVIYLVVVLLWWILATVLNPTEMMVFGSAAFAFISTVSVAYKTFMTNKKAVVERLKMRVLEEMVNLMKDSSSSLADSDATNNAADTSAITAGVLVDACKGEPAALELISEHIGAPPAILTTVLAAAKRDIKFINRSADELCELCNIPIKFKKIIVQIMMRALEMPASNGQLLRACFDLIPDERLRQMVEELEPVISQLVQCLHEEGDQLERMKDIVISVIQIVLVHMNEGTKQQLLSKAASVNPFSGSSSSGSSSNLPGIFEVKPKMVTAIVELVNCGAGDPSSRQVMALLATFIHRLQPQLKSVLSENRQWRKKLDLILSLLVECARDVNGEENDLLIVLYKLIDKVFDVQKRLNVLRDAIPQARWGILRGVSKVTAAFKKVGGGFASVVAAAAKAKDEGGGDHQQEETSATSTSSPSRPSSPISHNIDQAPIDNLISVLKALGCPTDKIKNLPQEDEYSDLLKKSEGGDGTSTLSGHALVKSAVGLMRQSLGHQPSVLRTIFKAVFQCKTQSDMNAMLSGDPLLSKVFNALNPDSILERKDMIIEIDDSKFGFVVQLNKLLERCVRSQETSGIKTQKHQEFNLMVRWVAQGVWKLKTLWKGRNLSPSAELPPLPDILQLSAGDLDRLSGATGIPDFFFDLFDDLGVVARSIQKYAISGSKLNHMLTVVMSTNAFQDLLPSVDPYYFPSLLRRWIPKVDESMSSALRARFSGRDSGSDSEVDDDEDRHPLLVSATLGSSNNSNSKDNNNGGIFSSSNGEQNETNEEEMLEKERLLEMEEGASKNGTMIALLMRLFLQKHIAADLSSLRQANRYSREKGTSIPASKSPAAASMRGKFENDMGRLLMYQVVGEHHKLRQTSGELVQKLLIEVCNFTCPKASSYEMERYVALAQGAASILERALTEQTDVLNVNSTVAAHNLKLTPAQLCFMADNRVLLKPENRIIKYFFELSKCNSVLKSNWSPSDEGYQLLLRRCQEAGMRSEPCDTWITGQSKSKNKDDDDENDDDDDNENSINKKKRGNSPPNAAGGDSQQQQGQKKSSGIGMYTSIVKKYNVRNLSGEEVISVSKVTDAADAVAAMEAAEKQKKLLAYHSYESDQYISALDAILFCTFVTPHGACRCRT